MSRRNRIAFFFLTFVCMLCVDRTSKLWASENLSFTEHSHNLGVVDFILVHNEGAAFGMGQGQTWLFLVIAAVVVVAIVSMLMQGKFTRTIEVVSAALIVAGAVGNCIDRLTTGYVVDFLNFTFMDFPVFNFADCCITVGAVLMVVAVFTVVKGEKDKIFAELEAQDEERREQLRKQADAERVAEAERLASMTPEEIEAEKLERLEQAHEQAAASAEAGGIKEKLNARKAKREMDEARAEAEQRAARAAEDEEFAWWDEEDESNR